MGNTDTIKIEDREFRIFRKIPVPIARKIQKLLIEMTQDFKGNLQDLEKGLVNLRDVQGINMDILYEVHDLLLTNVVISPKITKADVDNLEHELQPYFQDLIDLLFERFTKEKEDVKKKSPILPS